MSKNERMDLAVGEDTSQWSGKAVGSPMYDRLQIAEIAEGVGDPQCYKGKAGGAPKYKVGDLLRVRDLPDVFYNQTPGYTRGIVGVVEAVVYESPTPEDEAWGRIDLAEWFYLLGFRHSDLWAADDSDTNLNDTVQVEMPERWLEPA